MDGKEDIGFVLSDLDVDCVSFSGRGDGVISVLVVIGIVRLSELVFFVLSRRLDSFSGSFRERRLLDFALWASSS